MKWRFIRSMTSIRISLGFRLTCKSETTNLTQDKTRSQKDSAFKASVCLHAQDQIIVKSWRHALHGKNLVLNAVPAASVVLSLTESVTTMPLLHFLEDEFGEVEKILL